MTLTISLASRKKATAILGGSAILGLCVLVWGLSSSRAGTEPNTHCGVKGGIKVCYPETWAHGNDDAYVASPLGADPPHLEMRFVVAERTDDFRSMTANSAMMVLFNGNPLFAKALEGQPYFFAKNEKSKRGYWQFNTQASNDGVPGWYVDGKGGNHIAYEKAWFNAFFPASSGGIWLECTLTSTDRGPISSAVQPLVDSLVKQCESIFSVADQS